MTGDLVLGIDLGTSSAKAGIFDERGTLVALARRAHSDWLSARSVRQNPNAWWQACHRVAGEVVSTVDAQRIGAVCSVGLAPTVVCIDRMGNVTGNSPTWGDHSAESERREVTEVLNAKALGPVLFLDALAHLLRLKRRGSQQYRRARWVLQAYEFVAYRLTGEVASVPPYPGCRPWSTDVFHLLDLDSDMLPARLCQPGEVFGTLSSSVAAELGLPPDVPVVAGTVDSFAAWLGTATLDSGDLCVTAGTTSCAALVSERAHTDALCRASAIRHPARTGWVLTAPMSTGGVFLDWLAGQLPGDRAQARHQLCAEAGDVALGANGLLALPYLLGERSPGRDCHARGVMFGLAPWHTSGDMARAILESLAFAVGQMCDVFTDMGAHIDKVRLAGGLAYSPAWAAIVADTVGSPVEVPAVTEAGVVGAAALARVGTGQDATLEQAARVLVRVERTTEPDDAAHRAYKEQGQRYRRLYRHVKDDFRALAEMESQHQSLEESMPNRTHMKGWETGRPTCW